MKNQIIKTPTKGKEYFGFNDTDLVVSSKKHDDINSLVGVLEKKSLLETINHIPISNITEIKYNENDSLLKIGYLKKNKQKTFKISFDSPEPRNAIANSLSEIKSFDKSYTPEGKAKPLLINLFFILIALMVTAGLAGTAYEAANGVEIEQQTGRRSGIKNILISISTALGPIGVGVIGGLIILYMLYRAIKRWQNPANDVLFK